MPGFNEVFLPGIPSFVSTCFTTDFKGIEYLLPAELAIVAQSVEKRQIEFSTGRYCAQQALAVLINSQPAVLQGKGREPLWPHGMVGSISHSNKLAGAVVALQQDVTAIGLDIETVGGVKPKLWDLVFHDAEQDLIRNKEERAATWATLLFSLKEAFYKLQYPLTGQFVDFKDILIAEKEGELGLSCANAKLNLNPVLLSDIEVRWTQTGDQIITLCYIKTC